MTFVDVVDALDGNTLIVAPHWRSGNSTGNLVRIYGMETPSITTRDGQLARSKVCLMLAGSTVAITRTYPPEGSVLPCEILFRGVPMWMHFPEYTQGLRAKRAMPCELPDIPIEMNTPR
ncbi:MAG: hypothetical protein K1Y02_24310 [Candidatus Hydrogenedentes bacterium]|nr:hypothetical protein [Candidatus Hydrogenedentota bacterium]